MLSQFRVLSSAAAIAVTCVVSAAAAYFYGSRCKEINEVMVFCKLQFNAFNCFDKMISYIENAKRCVNICMPGIHNPAIQGRLVSLLKTKKLKVRIIIDRGGCSQTTDNFMKELIDAGAEIRCKFNDSPHRMQHKFCLVDDKILMTGTLNWGNDRSSDHWNYVYITNKNMLVEPVKKSFYELWNEYSTDILSTCHHYTEQSPMVRNSERIRFLVTSQSDMDIEDFLNSADDGPLMVTPCEY